MNRSIWGEALCLVAYFLLLLGAGGVEAEWVDEGVLDEGSAAVLSAGTLFDPNEAPLFQLSRVEGIGRLGAGRIGAERGTGSIINLQQLSEIAGGHRMIAVSGESFRFGRPASLRLGVKEVIHWREGERGERGEILAGRDNWSARILWERDRGEKRWDDFCSWNFERQGERVRSIVVGDLSVRFGSGLIIGTVSPFGAPLSTSVFTRSRLVPYRSRAESNAHFGAALETAAIGGRLFLMATSTGRDARIDDNQLFSSIEPSGYHRTDREESRRDALRERMAAMRWEWSGAAGGAVALTGGAVDYNPPSGGGDLRRKPLFFRGDHLQAMGVDIRKRTGLADTMVEGAWSSAGGGAFRGAIALRRGGGALTVRLRSFSSRYHAPRGTAYHRFGSEPVGETGIMLLLAQRGLMIPGRLRARIHYFRSHKRTWLSEEPVEGIDWYVREEWRAGPISPWLFTSGEERLETRRGSRVSLGRSSWGAGAWCNGPAGLRIRLEGKITARITGGGGAKREAAGLSCLLHLGTASLSWTHLSLAETTLIFPVPALPGSIPLEWFGQGRGRGGFRGSLAFFPSHHIQGEVVFAAGQASLEIGWKTR